MIVPTPLIERRLLQIAVALGGCVPVAAGLGGILGGSHFLDVSGDLAADSHIRYLSGLLLAIGLIVWASIPRIQSHSARFALLTAIVVTGGSARLLAVLTQGPPGGKMLLALAMELIVTPALCLWQRRVARRTALEPKVRTETGPPDGMI